MINSDFLHEKNVYANCSIKLNNFTGSFFFLHLHFYIRAIRSSLQTWKITFSITKNLTKNIFETFLSCLCKHIWCDYNSGVSIEKNYIVKVKIMCHLP